MTRSPLNPLHDGAQFPETRRGAMPGYSTPDLGRVTHGSGCGVPLKHHLGRGFGPGSFSPALPGKGHATKYFSDYSPRHDANRDKAIFLRVVARLHALSIGDTSWNGRDSGTVTAMSAQALREAVTEACVAVAISEPTKAVARKTGLTERGVRAIREREHAPSLETAAAFGFAYPSVSTVLSHWISKMCQADFFEPETQRAFYRDYARASKWE